VNNSNIIQLFIKSAEQFPGRHVLLYGDDAITYSELLKDVKQTAAAYSYKGITQGDKVLVFVPMSIDLYRIVLALFYIGACPVFLDEWVSVSRLKKCCEVVPCKALVAGTKLLAAALFIGSLRKIPVKLRTSLQDKSADGIDPVHVNGEETALVTFTTGTTGTPKAANRTNNFLYAQYKALEPLLKNDAQVSFVSLPIVTLINIGLGKTTLLPPKGFTKKWAEVYTQISDDLLRSHADEIICSPSVLLKIVPHATGCAHNIKHVFTGGGAVFPHDAQKITNTFPGARATVVYGSTEAEPISHIDMDVLLATDIAAIQEYGLPVGTISIAAQCAVIPVTDKPIGPVSAREWQELILKPGDAGEIVVSGEHVLKGYVNNESAVKQQKINVAGTIWHRTGDAGRMDADGKLYLLGPHKEIIHHEGITYYPLITSYLCSVITATSGAALLLMNGQLVLVIESARQLEGVILNAAMDQLKLQAAAVRYVDSIPRDKRHNTKVDYEQLRALLDS